MNRHFIGIDLGTINDFTAVCWIERHGELTGGYWTEQKWSFLEYRLWHLERYLGEPYTKIIDRIQCLKKNTLISAEPRS